MALNIMRYINKADSPHHNLALITTGNWSEMSSSLIDTTMRWSKPEIV